MKDSRQPKCPRPITHRITHRERFLQSFSATWQPPRECKSVWPSRKRSALLFIFLPSDSGGASPYQRGSHECLREMLKLGEKKLESMNEEIHFAIQIRDELMKAIGEIRASLNASTRQKTPSDHADSSRPTTISLLTFPLTLYLGAGSDCCQRSNDPERGRFMERIRVGVYRRRVSQTGDSHEKPETAGKKQATVLAKLSCARGWRSCPLYWAVRPLDTEPCRRGQIGRPEQGRSAGCVFRLP